MSLEKPTFRLGYNFLVVLVIFGYGITYVGFAYKNNRLFRFFGYFRVNRQSSINYTAT